MARNYTRAEMETSITWDDEEKLARVYTASPITMRKLDKLCEQCAEYRRTWTETDSDGRVTAAKYEVAARLVRFWKPREVSEEEREAARERFSRYRAEQH